VNGSWSNLAFRVENLPIIRQRRFATVAFTRLKEGVEEGRI
jgi:hypothetical protein